MTLLLLAASAFAAPAPDFSLRDLDNRRVTLSEHSDEAVLLIFWATWCHSCLGELDAVQEMYASLDDQGLSILALSLDEARDRSKLKPVALSHGWTFPILWDQGGKISRMYNPAGGVPFSVVIDQRGEIILTRQGLSEGTVGELRAAIEGLLGVEAVPADEGE